MEFRSQVESPTWRFAWDICATVGSFLPALLLGVAFANIFQGIPIDEGGVYQGTLFTLLNPYGLLGGVLFLLLFLVHGVLWLAVKTEGPMHNRAVSLASKLWIGLLIVAVAFLVASWFSTHLYDNYLKNPLFYMIPLVLIPVTTVTALIMVRFFIAKGRFWKAWFASSTTIVGATLFGVVGLYPNLLPSSLNPAYSLTIYNSSSSPLTLKIMLGVALTFVPVVIAYQAYVYNMFKDKVLENDPNYEESY